MRSFFPSSSPALLQCWFSAALLLFSKIAFSHLPLWILFPIHSIVLKGLSAAALNLKGFGWKPESGDIFQP